MNPTGALDSKSTETLLRMFEGINRQGQTIRTVTHSTRAASHAGRVLVPSRTALSTISCTVET